jgi:hypothetical protein
LRFARNKKYCAGLAKNIKKGFASSVADPGCLFFYPGSNNNKKEEGEK